MITSTPDGRPFILFTAPNDLSPFGTPEETRGISLSEYVESSAQGALTGYNLSHSHDGRKIYAVEGDGAQSPSILKMRPEVYDFFIEKFDNFYLTDSNAKRKLVQVETNHNTIEAWMYVIESAEPRSEAIDVEEAEEPELDMSKRRTKAMVEVLAAQGAHMKAQGEVARAKSEVVVKKLAEKKARKAVTDAEAALGALLKEEIKAFAATTAEKNR